MINQRHRQQDWPAERERSARRRRRSTRLAATLTVVVSLGYAVAFYAVALYAQDQATRAMATLGHGVIALTSANTGPVPAPAGTPKKILRRVGAGSP